MAINKLINLCALSSLAILVCSFGISPVNANALSSGTHLMRHVRSSHGTLAAKRKRASGQRCRNRNPPADNGGGYQQPGSPAPAPAPPAPPAPPASLPPAGSGHSGRVGLAWPNGNDPSLPNFVTDHVSFIYTWSESCPDQAAGLGLECMPMLWGPSQDMINRFDSINHGAYRYVLGFNEVNEPGQANMSPQQAVDLWRQHIEPLRAQGVQLISPCTSSNPNGLTWMQEFLRLCNGGCTFDGVAIHYYDISADGFIDYINLWHNTFGKPIWVTEFACQNFNGGPQCDQGQIYDFYTRSIQFMDQADFVQGYFPFGFMRQMQGVNEADRLMGDNGSPTDLGYRVIQNGFY